MSKSTKSEREQQAYVERLARLSSALLHKNWILKEEDPELYYQVKDHFQELKTWFMEYTGLSMIQTRSLVKLEKVPVEAREWMGFRDFRSPLDYCLFTYGLWFLEGKTEFDQFLLTDLVEQIREHMLVSGLSIDWMKLPHRQAMVRACKQLRELGLLVVVEGEERDWQNNFEEGNVLYECSPHSRFVLRNFSKDIGYYDSIEELSDPIIYSDTTEGELKRRRHRIYRRYLFEPVVLDQHLTKEELVYLHSQRRKVIEEIEKMTGLEGARYKEGILFTYPEVMGEGELFPTQKTISDIAILFANHLQEFPIQEDQENRLSVDESGRVIRHREEIGQSIQQIKEQYSMYWSKEFATMAHDELINQMLDHMCEWQLGSWMTEDQFAFSPVLSRWQGKYTAQEVE